MGKRTAPRMSAAEAAMAAGMGPKRIDAMAMGRKLNPIRRFQAWMEQNRARTISRATRSPRVVISRVVSFGTVNMINSSLYLPHKEEVGPSQRQWMRAQQRGVDAPSSGGNVPSGGT